MIRRILATWRRFDDWAQHVGVTWNLYLVAGISIIGLLIRAHGGEGSQDVSNIVITIGLLPVNIRWIP